MALSTRALARDFGAGPVMRNDFCDVNEAPNRFGIGTPAWAPSCRLPGSLRGSSAERLATLRHARCARGSTIESATIPHVNTVLRFLGVMLAARLAMRLPGPLATVVTGALLVVTNLLPIWAVATGRAGMGDVFLIYWVENVVVWLCGIVRVATAEGDGLPVGPRTADGSMSLAGFFALHYGIFTLVHGIFAILMAVFVGLVGGLGQVGLLAALIAASHLFSLGVYWFGRNERLVVSPGMAMFAPYPRMLVLHVGIILGFTLIGGPDATDHGAQVTAVAGLCGLKTFADLVFHLVEHARRAGRLKVRVTVNGAAVE